MPIVESLALAVLGWVASPLVAKLLNEGFASLGINAERKLKKMKQNILPLLQSVIEEAEGSEHRSEVEDWLQRLKDAYDDAEDELDLLNYWRLEREAASAAASSSKRRTNRVRIPFRVPKPPKWIMPVLKGGRDMLSPKKIKLKRRLNKLEKIASEAEKLRDLLGAQPDQTEAVPNSRQTISVPPPKVFGRYKDRDEIIRRLKMEPAAIREPGSSSMSIIAIREPGSSSMPIIAIVGRPGVGKTTLAQYVYNKLEGEGCDRHFDLIMWVYASHNFNISKIMKKIIQQASIASEPQDPVNPNDLPGLVLSHLRNLDTMVVGNLDSLQELQLRMNKKLNAKKFLLVIDDVWCDGEGHKINWDTLFRCLSNFCSPGSKILVTSQTDDAPRKIVAAKSATLEYIHDLEELEENDFLDLFIHHALPSEEMDSSLRKDLEEECKTIAKKLNKDPTAAKIVGETIALNLADLLRSKGDWRTYLRTIAEKDWSGDKTKALMWSYQHLPAHLQRCFSYCSLYRRGYKFQALELVQLWMAQGFIKPDDQNKRMEDVGNDYLEMLVSRFYIQSHDSYYTLHELLCDLAEKVSRNDCVRIKSNGQSKIPSTIRHLCIPADKLNKNKEQICKLKKLHTLIITKGESDTSEENVATYIFNSLKKLRVLVLELNLENLAEFIGEMKDLREMKHLRVLRVYSYSKFVLPESVCTLYQLQVLEVGNASPLPKCLNNLVNLRYLQPSGIADIGKFTSLQGLEYFQVRKEKGFELEQLQSLNELRGRLHIDNLENVKSKESAIAANLKEKKHLDTLKLAWHNGEDNVNSNLDIEILEGLQLPPNLTRLYLEGCNITDHALSACLQTLTSLTSLSLTNIKTVTCLPSEDVLGNLKALQFLYLWGCWAFTSLGGIKSLPCLTHLFLDECPCLESKTAFRSSSLEKIQFETCANVDVILANADLPCLSDLKITRCHMRTASLRFGNLPSLRSLDIEDCSGLSFSVDLQELRSLELLRLWGCSNLQEVMNFPKSLKDLDIIECPNLEKPINIDPCCRVSRDGDSPGYGNIESDPDP